MIFFLSLLGLQYNYSIQSFEFKNLLYFFFIIIINLNYLIEIMIMIFTWKCFYLSSKQ